MKPHSSETVPDVSDERKFRMTGYFPEMISETKKSVPYTYSTLKISEVHHLSYLYVLQALEKL